MAGNVLRGGRTDFAGIDWPSELRRYGTGPAATIDELEQLAAGEDVTGFPVAGVIG